MKVWIVEIHDIENGCDSIKGVFDSELKAKRCEKQCEKKDDFYEGIRMTSVSDWKVE